MVLLNCVELYCFSFSFVYLIKSVSAKKGRRHFRREMLKRPNVKVGRRYIICPPESADKFIFHNISKFFKTTLSRYFMFKKKNTMFWPTKVISQY